MILNILRKQKEHIIKLWNWQTLTLTRNSAYRRRWRRRWRSRGQDGEGRRWRASAPSPDRPRWRQWPRRRRRTLWWRPARASFLCATMFAWPCSWIPCLGETSAWVSCSLPRWAKRFGSWGWLLPFTALTQAGLGANLWPSLWSLDRVRRFGLGPALGDIVYAWVGLAQTHFGPTLG